MPDDSWIIGHKYFVNVSFPFDSLEPYSTIGSLALGIPTFVVDAYVYIILLRNTKFRDNAYFQLFIAQGIIDLLAFVSNLLRYRLAMFTLFGRFYASLGDSGWATALCTTAVSLPRAQLIAQCLLTTNRLLAVWRPLNYNKWQGSFSRCGFAILILVPILVAVPDILTGFFFGAIYGIHGTLIFYSSAQTHWPGMMKFADGLATAFQFSLTLFAFLCNCVLIAIVTSKKGAWKTAGKGLVVTTLIQFLTHLTYSLIMVCYLYLPPPWSNAAMFTTIALDVISILPIWLLLAFSGSVRNTVFRKNGRKEIVRSTVAERGTVTAVALAGW